MLLPQCCTAESNRRGLAGIHIPSDAALTFFFLIDNVGLCANRMTSLRQVEMLSPLSHLFLSIFLPHFQRKHFTRRECKEDSYTVPENACRKHPQFGSLHFPLVTPATDHISWALTVYCISLWLPPGCQLMTDASLLIFFASLSWDMLLEIWAPSWF